MQNFVELNMKFTRQTAILIYDGECNLCQAGKRWIEKRALPGHIEFLPCQSQERQSRFPEINKEQCMAAMQFLTEIGELYQGADAIPEILSHLKRWRWLEKLMRLRPFRATSPFIYRWIARNRQILSCALPHHKNGPERG